MRLFLLFLILFFISDLNAQSIGRDSMISEEVMDSLIFDNHLSWLKEAILGEVNVTSQYEEDSYTNYRYIPQDCLGSQADATMEQFLENLAMDRHFFFKREKGKKLTFLSFLDNLQNKNVNINLNLIPVVSKIDGKDFKITQGYETNDKTVEGFNKVLFKENNIKLFHYAFRLPDYTDLYFEGYLQFRAPKDIGQRYTISRNDVGKEIFYNNYPCVIEYFDNNKVQIRTKNKVYVHVDDLAENRTVEEESRILRYFDIKGNVVKIRSWSSDRPIIGKEWGTFLKHQANPDLLTKELRKVYQEDMKGEKDYLHFVLSINGPLVDRIEYEQIEYAKWTQHIEFDFRDGGLGSYKLWDIEE